jgi:hypothetical protein
MNIAQRAFMFVIGLAAWVGLCTPPALAQTTGAYDLSVSQMASTTCSSGEPVALGGSLHFDVAVSTTTDTTASPPTVIYSYQTSIASALSGVGQITNTNYTAGTGYSGGSQSATSAASFTVALRYGLDSHGSAPSMMLNQTLQVNVDNAGGINASVVSSSTDCVDQPIAGGSH